MSGHRDIEKVLAELTLEEKASLCLGSDFWHTAPVQRLDIPALMVTDGPHGLRKQPDEADHAGIGGSNPATCFPTASSLASSWNVSLARRVGEALGVETQAEEVAVLLGPGVNIKRSPLCGRNFEYFSEDPALAGVLGTAFVQGVQSQGVGTSVKHFAANNQETDRVRVSADVDERTLREIYLPAFERIVKEAQPWTVMCSYNRLNGTHTSQDPWLLTTVLRDEWGFDGLVVSDWGAVHDRVAAVAAGLDLEMPPQLGWSDVAITDAVRSGELDEAVLDVAVARVLRLVDRATTGARPGTTVDYEAHHALARVAAREGAVLLKNDDAVLPLALSSGQTVAVIGEFARTPRYQGAGSSQVNPTHLDVPLDELRAAVPDGVEVTFHPGDGDEAVALAGAADVAVLFLGLAAEDESEGFDRSHMDLPAEQVDLLHRVAAVNDRVVVVLANGSAVLTSGWEQDAGAILECWLSGQAAGGAVADLLLGVANPSGRLAETIPVSLEQTTAYLNFPGDSGHVRYGEGLFVGYRGHDAKQEAVSYPFGHGLSYTTFAYDVPTVDVAGSHAAGDLVVTVTCRVTNTGDRAGQEVVQLYVEDVEASVARPVRELKAFTKLDLAPGESADAVLVLTSRDFSFWSETVRDWVLEAGEFVLHVGASSRDLRTSATVKVDAPRVAAPLGPMSTLEEWLADPDGRAVLAETVGTDEDGRFTGTLGDAQMVTIIGNFPMQALAGFGNVPIDRPQLAEMVARLA